ncbi:MAG: peptide ligase PGM1-related protein [Bacteroidota bacterium]
MFWIDDYTISSKRCFTNAPTDPPAGSDMEKEIFRQLQQNFKRQYEHIFPDKLASKTVVIVPSMTLDHEILSKIKGHVYYEERMLCMLMLLRMPQTNVVFVSSISIDEGIIDYYLHLLPGITGHHARQRLTMLSCYDASAKPLTQKILERPRIINKIKKKIIDLQQSHLVCFNVAEPERTLAVQLGIPIYGCDPELLHLGSKSGSRILFKSCGITIPDGYENLHSQKEISEALFQLKLKHPTLQKAVLKINEGFSGEGNAIFNYQNVLPAPDLKEAIEASLSYIHVVADKVNYEQYYKKFGELGGIVEAFLDGDIKCSPSVQCRINPIGQVSIISTHDQLLGGEDNQVFIGANFPASKHYAVEIAQLAEIISERMVLQGVLGRFSIDFLSILLNNEWVHYAIEINLRKGGTTHPFLMLQFLTDGVYDAASGIFLMTVGEPRYYFASDNVSSPFYAGLTPFDLIEIAMFHGIMYDSTKQEGVVFHLIGALSQYGKLGMICIAASPERAKELYLKTIEILNFECMQNEVTGC